jgi:thiamine-phosphate pyrophosphorylase
MQSRAKEQSSKLRPQLYLVTTPSIGATGDLSGLEAVLDAASVAAVLVWRDGSEGENAFVRRALAIGERVQGRGVAMLLRDQAGLAQRSQADGAHLTSVESLRAAVPSLKPDLIAGAGGLVSRHDAMVAAELGADYIMFGGPDLDGRTPPFPAVLERVAWWSEVFEVPCVGWAETVTQAVDLANAGADFVAVGEFIWNDARGPAVAMAAVATAIGDVEVVR